jgi:hypothetical protein
MYYIFIKLYIRVRITYTDVYRVFRMSDLAQMILYYEYVCPDYSCIGQSSDKIMLIGIEIIDEQWLN